MSDSVRPHRQQPTRLPCPWDSPGMNTGVGCHFLLQCMKVKSESEIAESCPNPSDPMDCSLPGSSIHGIFQAKVLDGVPLPSPIMEYYLAIKRNTFESVLMRWMNLEPIIQSEISQKEKDKYCICNLKRWYWWIYFQGNSGKTDIENRPMDMGEGEEGEDEMYRESNLEVYVK